MSRAIGLLRFGVEILLGFPVRGQRWFTHYNDCLLFEIIANRISSFLKITIMRIHLPMIIFQQRHHHLLARLMTSYHLY